MRKKSLLEIKITHKHIDLTNYIVNNVFIVIVIFFSFVVLSKVKYFPDFSNYDNYIKTGNAFPRFIREPLSGGLMYFTGVIGFGATEFYLFVWIINICVIYKVSFKIAAHFWPVLLLILIFNPVSLIMFQTPRQFLASSFFLIALITKGRNQFIVLVFVLLIHSVSGFFLIALVSISKFNLKYTIIFFFLIFLAYLLYLNKFYFFYIHEFDRGFGRFLYLSTLFLLYTILSLKKNKEKYIYYFIYYIFLLMMYRESPFATRFFSYYILPLNMSLFSDFQKRDSYLFIMIFALASILFSIYFIINGLYGYGA